MNKLRYAYDHVRKRYRKEWSSSEGLTQDAMNEQISRFLESFPDKGMSMWEEVVVLEIILGAEDMLSHKNRTSIQLLLGMRPERESVLLE